MYAVRPWTIRQYAGFSTAEESNASTASARRRPAGRLGRLRPRHPPRLRLRPSARRRRRRQGRRRDRLGRGHEDPVRRHPARPGVGVDDDERRRAAGARRLHRRRPRSRASPQEQLSGTIQNDILKEFMVRNTYIYPPEPSDADRRPTSSSTRRGTCRSSTRSRSPATTCRKPGANQALELAFTLADGREYVRAALAQGARRRRLRRAALVLLRHRHELLPRDREAARGAAALGRIMTGVRAEEARGSDAAHPLPDLGLDAHRAGPATTTSCARRSRRWRRCSAARRACTPTRSTRRSRCRPTSPRAIARNTQLIIQEETHIPDVVDPWAGSYMMETLTQEHGRRGLGDHRGGRGDGRHDQGGAVAAGPSCKIEASAAEKQARIDSRRGRDRRRQQVPARRGRRRSRCATIDNAAVRETQIARLEGVRAKRDAAAVAGGARRARRDARADAARATCSSSRSTRCARARPSARSPTRSRRSGAATAPTRRRCPASTARPTTGDEDWDAAARREIDAFAAEEGRRPRMMVAKLGQDGHDRGAKVIATAFADLGFDVDIGPLFQTPEEARARRSRTTCTRSACRRSPPATRRWCRRSSQALQGAGRRRHRRRRRRRHPAQDYEFLYEAGVEGIFGPGTPIPASAKDVLEQIARALAAR